MEKNYKINDLKKKINNEAYHIFFISNPIFEVITYLWIKNFNIEEKKIILINLRSNSTNLIKIKTIFFKRTIIDRL